MSTDSSNVPHALDQFIDLARQIHVMKDYCAAEGVGIDEKVAGAIADFEKSRIELARLSRPQSFNETQPAAPVVTVQLVLNDAVANALPQALRVAYTAHAALIVVVKPATPASIEWTTAPTTDKSGKERVLFVWCMAAVAVVSLIIFVMMLYADSARAAREGQVSGVSALVSDYAGSPSFTDVTDKDLRKEHYGEARQGAQFLRHAVESFSKRWEDDATIATLSERTVTVLNDIETKAKEPPAGSTSPTLTGQVAAVAELDNSWRHLVQARTKGGANGAAPDFILLVSAGALGAMFYNLYCAHKYIVDRTFDRAQMNRYIIRFFMGMVAGMILGHFGGELLKNAGSTAQSPAFSFSRAFMAFLGGYAVEVVDLVLLRIVAAIGALFQGPAKTDQKA